MVAGVKVKTHPKVIGKTVHKLILKAGRALATLVISSGGVTGVDGNKIFAVICVRCSPGGIRESVGTSVKSVIAISA
ncbi:hypothetical protein HORIV_55390 [Vreelandella olivaria]|uniref:Uncharacterized protein n=1 Tax=Vreelandella olivaria TaxID=390919 RepID=A0ABN5X2P1_9GAMM|nr:hypothetical protein HORIV_55390 [Halomonas olivaria]